MNTTISAIFLGVFVLIMFGVGIVSMKKASTMKGFLLGNRNAGAWMSAFAYGTSYFSAVLFIGYAGKTGWTIGIGGVLIGLGNALLGCLLAWLLLAKRTRRMTRRLNASTMPEFFHLRYQSNFMKILAACTIFIFLVPYSASVYMGLGYLFDTVFPGIPYKYCMIFIAVVTAVYLVLGGYVATILTDFIQGLIMVAGIVIMVVMIVRAPEVGGIANGVQSLGNISKDFANIFGGANWKSLLSLILLTSFGTWGLPQMVHKFYAIKDGKAIKKATIISTALCLLISGGAYFTGAFGRLFLNNELPAGGYDQVMPNVLSKAFANGAFGMIVFNIIVLLVLSASMSTLSSIVLTSSSSITVDLLQGYIKKDMSPKTSMLVMRALCLVFVGVSLLIALQKPAIIITLMSFSWGTVSGAFIGPYLWGLYGKGITKAGATTGMLAGLLVSLVLTIGSGFDAANAPLFGAVAMAVSLVTVPVVSLFTKKYDPAFVSHVFAAEKAEEAEEAPPSEAE